MKGPSWLAAIPHYDIIRGTTIDYMHAVLLGVCRQLLKLWLDSRHNKELWYLGNKLDELDRRLCSIKPPSEVKRIPRSIRTTRKYWKGIYIVKNYIMLRTHTQLYTYTNVIYNMTGNFKCLSSILKKILSDQI